LKGEGGESNGKKKNRGGNTTKIKQVETTNGEILSSKKADASAQKKNAQGTCPQSKGVCKKTKNVGGGK